MKSPQFKRCFELMFRLGQIPVLRGVNLDATSAP